MKNMLMLTYYYPPSGGAGSIRMSEFTTYLPQYGWDPYVISTRNPVFQKGYMDIPDHGTIWYTQNIISVQWLEKLLDIDITWKKARPVGWIPLTVLQGYRIIQTKSIQMIFASSPSWTAITAGVLLKKLTGVPLVVELRDAWSLNPSSVSQPSIIRTLNTSLEKKCLTQCDHFITVTKGLLELYREKYSFLKNKSSLIYNGFDMSKMPEHVSKQKPEKFTITYAGNIYTTKLFAKFLDAVKAFAQKIPDEITLLIISHRKPMLSPLIKEYNLESCTEWHDYLPYPETLSFIFKSHLLLLIIDFDTQEQYYTHVLTTKIFDYLASGNPILALIPEGEAANMIRHYSDNSYIVSDYSVKRIEKALYTSYTLWKKGEYQKISGHVKEFRKKFNRKKETKQLAAVFDTVLEDSQCVE